MLRQMAPSVERWPDNKLRSLVGTCGGGFGSHLTSPDIE